MAITLTLTITLTLAITQTMNSNLRRMVHVGGGVLAMEGRHQVKHREDLTGTLHFLMLQLSQPPPSSLAPVKSRMEHILVPAYPGYHGKWLLNERYLLDFEHSSLKVARARGFQLLGPSLCTVIQIDHIISA